MLRLSHCSGGYGSIPVVRDVSLDVAEGEFVGVLGHNGMGKSTMLKMIVGQAALTAGEITFLDRRLDRLPTHERVLQGLGYVPQGRQIFPSLSVIDNLRMGCARLSASVDERIKDVLRQFPRLVPILDRPGGALSGGEQQLLALARCMCGKPRLMLLDEPTEGIQPSIVQEIGATLRRIHETEGVGIILVEQNVDFVKALADRAIALRDGRLVLDVAMTEDLDKKLATQAFGRPADGQVHLAV